jgi:hypothetical protein
MIIPERDTSFAVLDFIKNDLAWEEKVLEKPIIGPSREVGKCKRFGRE